MKMWGKCRLGVYDFPTQFKPTESAVNPANGIYVMGSPAVDEATIHYKPTISFKMIAVNNSAANKYIQKVEYNGKSYTKSYITHDMIVKGGELQLYMGSAPSKTFGVAKTDRPL